MKTHPVLPMAVPVFLLVLLISAVTGAGCLNTLSGGAGSSLRSNTTGDLKAYFLDIGQGDASVILFKDKVILIDAGETDMGERVVSDLQKLGVRKIDLLVATHPHSDHIGGMQGVLEHFPVEKVLDSGLPTSSPLYEYFLETVDEKNIPYVVAEQGQAIDLDPSLRILVLSPPKDRIGDDLNTNSIVLRISYGTINLLYTGDATTPAEDVMEKTGYPLDAQVLKISHHGSSDSSSAAFLSRVRPELAVISLSADNPYGHPHRETLDRLEDAGPVLYRTDRNGTILVMSDGATFSVMTENGGRDIWSYAGTGAVTTVTPVPPVPSGTTGPFRAFTLPATLPALPYPVAVPVPSLSLPALQIGNASSVYISAVQFNAPGDDTKNLNGEWVRLNNSADEPVLLAGWTLADRNSAEPYRFPAFLLLPQSSVTVYTGSGALNDTALFMGRTEPLWGNSDDMAILKDGSGNIIDRQSEDDSP
ncbi:MAG: lamin tail domain-containing protein [Methanoregula sp.]|nr:lamin tail domain-containing protein [Methanoregula sp.]